MISKIPGYDYSENCHTDFSHVTHMIFSFIKKLQLYSYLLIQQKKVTKLRQLRQLKHLRHLHHIQKWENKNKMNKNSIV